MRAVKAIMKKPNEHQYPHLTMIESFANFINFTMIQNEALPNYRKRFEDTTKIAEEYGAKYMISDYVKTLPDYKAAKEVYEDQMKVLDREWQAFLAVKLAQGADWNKYGFCLRNWETQYANKADQYPKTLDAAVCDDTRVGSEDECSAS